ncbi:MAG TPA: hypothetical protein VNT75_22420 [Symbiobacteriaceae bacterium]|nr:hypothetical protein [Symbiobacteriaceae bacterium]
MNTVAEKRVLATAEFVARAGDVLRNAVTLLRAWERLTYPQEKQSSTS